MRTQNIGPAKPIRFPNSKRICWGWLLHLTGRPDPILITACGRGSAYCGRGQIVIAKPDCPDCKEKAATDPDLIAGRF